MTPIRAIVFDCFHTVVDLRFEDLPRLEMPGGHVASSAPPLAAYLQKEGLAVDPIRLHEALVHSWMHAEEVRRSTLVETPARERMLWMLGELDLPTQPELVHGLAQTHAETLLAASNPMPYAVEVLQGLSEALPLGMVSNFDRTATVHAALERHALSRYFSAVVVSEDAGVVKPHPDIFASIAARLAIPAAEILFVGDQPYADMQGALDAGMRAAWLPYRPEQAKELPAGVHILKDLSSLKSMLP